MCIKGSGVLIVCYVCCQEKVLGPQRFKSPIWSIANINTLCVGPEYANQEEVYFDILHDAIVGVPEMTKFKWLQGY